MEKTPSPESRQVAGRRAEDERGQPAAVGERMAWPEDYGDELSLGSLLSVLWRERWTIVLSVVGVLAVALVLTLRQPTTYTANGSFLPPSGGEGQMSGLAGMAARFGVNVPRGGGGGRSPQFYVNLLESRWVLLRAADTEYPVPASESDSVAPLPEILGIEGPSASVRARAAMGTLNRWISVDMDQQTGLVELSVTTPWPEMSQRVGERLMKLVTEFDEQVRQSQAASEREFMEERLAEARSELLAAEERLETFLQRNRSYQNAPELVFEHQRIQRRVDLRQQVYISLAQSLEEVRIRELKSTPAVTVVDPVLRPLSPDPSNLRSNSALALTLGGMLGLGLAFLREYARNAWEGSSDDRDFALLKQKIGRDLQRLWRKTSRLVGGS